VDQDTLVSKTPTYSSENGFATFMARLQAGCEVHLPLPFRFVDTLGGTP
jgi:hypothetical protein